MGNDTLKVINDGELYEPTLNLFPEMLPTLMKALAEHGVRVSEQSFIEGNLEATKEHLSDMRKLVFLEQ